MARFAVVLTDSERPGARLYREITATTENRAIIYAQKALRRARQIGKYFSYWPNTYTVIRMQDDGSLSLIATGVNNDAPTQKKAKAPKRNRKKPPVTLSGIGAQRTQTRTVSTVAKGRGFPKIRLAQVPKSKTPQAVSPSALRTSIAQMYADASAKRVPHDKLPPMGSDTCS